MPTLPDWVSDFRYGARKLTQSPSFLTVAVLSLGLGIGANTAIFTLVDNVLLRLLPVEAPEELHMVAVRGNQGNLFSSWNYPDYAAFRDQATRFDGLIAYSGAGGGTFGFRAEGEQAARVASGSFVSGNYFQVLRMKPVIGRTITPDDDKPDAANPVIVLAHKFWKSHFGERTDVLGKKVTISNTPMTIVGVAGAGFTGLEVGSAPDFFMPIWMRTPITGRTNWNNRNHWWINVMGRVPAGVNPQSLSDQLTAITHHQAELEIQGGKDPKFVNKGRNVVVTPGSQGFSFLRNRLEKPLKILMGVVGLLLLIACANVANLLLARAATREREIAVRMAIGAGRARIVRQLLAESLLLAVAGGVMGLLFAQLGVKGLATYLPQVRMGGNVFLDLSPDWRILGFTFAVSLLTGVLFGLIPALQATKRDFVPSLKEDTGGSTTSRGRNLLRRGLVVAQVTLSLMLLIGAGLFARSLGNLRGVDLGFEPSNVIMVELDPTKNGYKEAEYRRYFERLLERTRAIPGVRAASLASITPLAGSMWNDNISVPGYQWKEGENKAIYHNAVTPDFFATMGVPILLGRDFREQDNPAKTIVRGTPFNTKIDPQELEGPRVSIVNEAFARKFFGNQNPIGQRFSRHETYIPEGSYEIVGVVKDAKYYGLRNKAEEPMLYVPAWRVVPFGLTLMVRTPADPASIVSSIRSEAMALDAGIPILQTRTLSDQLDSNIVQERFLATLCSFFGILALLLAAIGLYGVMAGSVARRTREIGIRMALGARQGMVLRLVMHEAVVMLVLGAIIAIPSALALTKLAQALLFGIESNDPASVAAAAIVLLAVGTFAAFLPAQRAATIDPLRALRHE